EIKNWGKTPVQVTHISIVMQIRDTPDPLPKDPPYGEAAPANAFLVTMEDFGFTIPVSAGDHFNAVQDGAKTLYLIGYVDYTDKFGNQHRGGYARKYDAGTPAMLFVTQEGYNYDRNRENAE